jgi:hypothetical protein
MDFLVYPLSMPKSKSRKKDPVYVPDEFAHLDKAPKESPAWLAPLMVAAFIAGLVWIVIFYVSGTLYPVPHVGAWNMVIGFGFIAAGFTLATKWR